MNREKTKQKEYNTTKEKALNSGEIRFHNIASKRFFFNSVRKMDTTRSIEDALAIRSVYYILRRGGRREKGKRRKRGTLAAIFNDASAEKKRKGGKKSRDASQLFIRSCDSLRSNKPTDESRGRRRMSMSRALTACALIAKIFYRDRDSRRICQLEVREEVIIFPVRNDSDDELAVVEALFCA